MKLVEVNSIEY